MEKPNNSIMKRDEELLSISDRDRTAHMRCLHKHNSWIGWGDDSKCGPALTHHFTIVVSDAVVNRCPGKHDTLANVVLMWGQRRRRWSNIKTPLPQRLVFAGVLQLILNKHEKLIPV